jgi:hypothetical protein
MHHDPKTVFATLPNVKTIWVTKDGNFHLHPHNGGERIDRDDIKETQEEPQPAKVVKIKRK